MSDNNAATGGIGFTGALAITFIVLKLTHVIDWPWVWVLSPIWISASIAILFILALFGIAALMAALEEKK